MKNKLLSATVAVSFLLSCAPNAIAGQVKEPVYAATTVQALNAPELDLPTGDMKKLRGFEAASEIEAGVYTDKLGIAAETPGFYSFGSDYGREYLETQKGKVYVDFYDKLNTQCKAFEGYYGDVSGTSVEFIDGTFEMIYYLPMQAGKGDVYGLTIKGLYEVIMVFMKDHPEYYWLDSFIYSGKGSSYTVNLTICEEYTSGAERQRLDQEIQSNFEKYVSAAEKYKPLGEYMTAKKVHDDIVEAVDYAYEYFEIDGVTYSKPSDSVVAHNIVAVLDNNEATMPVCEGYAKAYDLILNALGIESIFLTGYGEGEDHAWNLVRFDDDRFYWVDLTWDDVETRITYNYFARGNTAFNADHTPDTPQDSELYFQYALPEVPDTDFEVIPLLNDNIINGMDMIHNGTFGDGMSWAIYEDRVLYIRGTGDMPRSFTYDNDLNISAAPWCEHQSDINFVIIGDGITSVSDFAFTGCVGINYAYIPDGTKSLGDFVLANALDLKQIRFPASLISIGQNLVFSANSLFFSDIYYDGTEEEWNKVSKKNADIPVGITMHYRSAPEPTETPAPPIDDRYEYDISELALTNEDGEELAPCDIEGAANLHIAIDARDAGDRHDLAIVAMYYPDGTLNRIIRVELQTGSTGGYTADCVLNAEKGEVGEIKAFIWSSLGDLKPLACVKGLK